MNFKQNQTFSAQPGPMRRRMRPHAERPNFLAAGLGVLCACGVLGALGLLYSFS